MPKTDIFAKKRLAQYQLYLFTNKRATKGELVISLWKEQKVLKSVVSNNVYELKWIYDALISVSKVNKYIGVKHGTYHR